VFDNAADALQTRKVQMTEGLAELDKSVGLTAA
jgi:hypothetical protein